MHADFTTPKGLKITPSDEKKKKQREESKNRKIRERRKKTTDITFNFYIVYVGDPNNIFNYVFNI